MQMDGRIDEEQQLCWSRTALPAAPPTACDVCYLRKIKCDRKMPCGNCTDSQIQCQRERQRSERKPREIVPKELSDTLNDIKQRMGTLEASLSQLIALQTHSVQGSSTPKSSPRKRRRAERLDRDLQNQDSPNVSSPYVTAGAESQKVSPFRTVEVQTLIQNEFKWALGLDRKQEAAFKSALTSLKEKLNTSFFESDAINEDVSDQALKEMSIPHLSLIQWMLLSGESGRPIYSATEFIPIISRKSLARMSHRVLKNPNDRDNLACLICITAYAGYFLQEIVLLGHSIETGFEDELSVQAQEHFATTRAAISRILTEAEANLDNLQALCFGVMISQEYGDFAAAWLLTEAACKMCIALDLHKRVNRYSSRPQEMEAYYCFTLMYKYDKGLAMNLGRPSSLDDSTIEVDVLRPPWAPSNAVDNYRIYLQLSQIQSRIMNELRSSDGASRAAFVISNILGEMEGISQLKSELQQIPQNLKHDSRMETAMVDFAFFSVKTVLFLSGPQELRLVHKEAILHAARSALCAVQIARELPSTSQYNRSYMWKSFAHWSILHYPFTPFFVLFCNVISSCNLQDFIIMQQFVAYLEEAKELSTSIAKLHKLCIPFHSLASSMLISEDDQPLVPLYNPSQDHMPLGNAPSQTHSHTSQPMLSEQMYDMPIAQGGLAMGYQGLLQVRGGGYGDPHLWDFIGTQPMLQWLDSDFSNFEDSWGLPQQPPPP